MTRNTNSSKQENTSWAEDDSVFLEAIGEGSLVQKSEDYKKAQEEFEQFLEAMDVELMGEECEKLPVVAKESNEDILNSEISFDWPKASLVPESAGLVSNQSDQKTRY